MSAKIEYEDLTAAEKQAFNIWFGELDVWPALIYQEVFAAGMRAALQAQQGEGGMKPEHIDAIETLARDDAAVHAFLHLKRRDHLAWGDVLAQMVLHLARDKAALTARLIDAEHKRPAAAPAPATLSDEQRTAIEVAAATMKSLQIGSYDATLLTVLLAAIGSKPTATCAPDAGVVDYE